LRGHETKASANLNYADRELEACQEHYLSLGLEFFQRVTQANHAERISLLRDNLSVSYSFLTQTLAEEPPNPIILSFIENEAGPDTLDHAVDLPNAAWSWSMICVEVLRYFQPEAEGLRKWGYAVWDKERLCDWGNGSVRTVFQEVQIEQRLPPVVRERYW